MQIGHRYQHLPIARPESEFRSDLDGEPADGLELGSVLACVQALGGRLTVEAEIGGRVYTVDLAEAV